MNTRIIECVPNFSEGIDAQIIQQIAKAIEDVAEVKLLNVDPGKDTNRTVITFAGEPEAVSEAAFRAVKKAQELIDMTTHHGTHPRMGATDVLPLIPIQGITLEETAEIAEQLGKRIGEELQIPIYLYEASAKDTRRRNLSYCRSGEYEGLEKKLSDPELKPDYGPAEFNDSVARSGATVVGARDFLIAVNFNLNTTSTRRANAIAFDVREKGRPMREGNSLTGEVCKDDEGNTIMLPGSLKGTKAIGWYIDEYKMAQVSMNITDIHATPLHIAFEEVRQKAEARGVRVTGTEIVGLVPKSVIIDAGKYYLEKQQRSLGISEEEIIRVAEQSLGLNELNSWDAKSRIIEYLLEDKKEHRLLDLSLKDFLDVTASESPAPGGGSASAYIGAIGIALGTMVANLSAHKRGWDEKWEIFSSYAQEGQIIMRRLSGLVDEDTASFNRVMECFSMPKSTEEERKAYLKAREEAYTYAARVPLSTMKACLEAIPILQSMLELGNQNSRSDILVGLLAVQAGCEGAYQNVRINTDELHNLDVAEEIVDEAKSIRKQMHSCIKALYK